MLYGDYEGDVFSTGGEVEIAQVSAFVVEWGGGLGRIYRRMV